MTKVVGSNQENIQHGNKNKEKQEKTTKKGCLRVLSEPIGTKLDEQREKTSLSHHGTSVPMRSHRGGGYNLSARFSE